MAAFNVYVYPNTQSVDAEGPADGLRETLDAICSRSAIPDYNVEVMDENPNLSAGSIYDLIEPWRRWLRRNGTQGPGSHLLAAEGSGGIAASSGRAWSEPMACVSMELGFVFSQEVLHNFLDSRLPEVRDLGYPQDVEHSLGKVFQGGDVSPMTAGYVDDGHAAGGQCGREERTQRNVLKPTECTVKACVYSWEEHGSGGGGNRAPTADASASSRTVRPGTDVTFDGSGSSDSDGSIQSYEWAFGDGATASGESVTHAYDSAGSYDAELTVTDDGGKSDSDSVTIEVQDDGLMVETRQAENVESFAATLVGAVTDLGGASSADAAFEYRQEGANDWQSTSGQSVDAGEYTADVSALSADTTYEFRAIASTSSDDATGSVTTFTTGSSEVQVETTGSSGVGETAATLEGELLQLYGGSGGAHPQVWFEYRESGASDWQETSQTPRDQPGTFDADVSGLSADTTYEFRAVAQTDTSSDRGDVMEFTTEDGGGGGGLTIETRQATDVGSGSATLQGEVTALGSKSTVDSYFVWREEGARYWSYTATTPVGATTFAVEVGGVQSGATYEFKAVGECGGAEDDGDVLTFSP